MAHLRKIASIYEFRGPCSFGSCGLTWQAASQTELSRGTHAHCRGERAKRIFYDELSPPLTYT
jgi:hypothetical protein